MIGFRVRSGGTINIGIRDAIISSLQHVHNLEPSKNSIYSFVNGIYDLPKSTGCVTITMAAGGGAGGTGVIKNGIFYSGGGGGAGGSCLKKPICITNPKNEAVSISTVIGRGGSVDTPDGTHSIVTVYVGKTVAYRHIAHGGLRGGCTDEDNNGGAGGNCSTNSMFGGRDGQQGSVTLAGSSGVVGGRGGNSAFEEGGLGGHQSNPFAHDDIPEYTSPSNGDLPHGADGLMGSGGGGSIPGLESNLTGGGGAGFIIIEM